MRYRGSFEERKERKQKMAALATPKKNSYVVKKDCASKIVESKTSPAKMNSIKENAMLFQKNNLKKMK